MSAKRWLAIGVLAAGLAVSTEAARAEEATPKKEDEPAPAPKEAAKKKDPFFGDRFAMYLETRGGPASIDAIDNPVTSGVQSSSDSEIRYNGTKAGQFTVGWTLPRGRGQYLLSYNAMADGDYELDATGSQLSYQAVNGQSSVGVSFPLPWWHVTIRNGVLNTTQTPPVWDSQLDDANGNALPDFNEIRYPAPPTVNVTASVGTLRTGASSAA